MGWLREFGRRSFAGGWEGWTRFPGEKESSSGDYGRESWDMERRLGYSGSIMKDIQEDAAIDPIGLTRQLCEIESTTYNEGAVGDFLADFLAGRGWAVEKTPVEQPEESGYGRRALECVCGRGRGDAGPGVFDAYGYGSAVYSVQRGCGVYVRAGGFRREGDYCGAGGGRGGATGGGIQGWDAVCERRGARLGGREGGEPDAKGQQVSDQRGADGQSSGAGIEGGAAGFTEDEREDGALGLSGTGRKRGAQDGGGAGQAAEVEVAGG